MNRFFARKKYTVSHSHLGKDAKENQNNSKFGVGGKIPVWGMGGIFTIIHIFSKMTRFVYSVKTDLQKF